MTEVTWYQQKIIEVYSRASAVQSGRGKFTTVNELTDQVPAVRPEVLHSAIECLVQLGPVMTPPFTKVLSEEDKGAILAGLFSVRVILPLAMARHNVPYEIPGSIVVPLDMEYMTGNLTVNGLTEGDKLLLIDDTLASGCTIVSLFKAVQQAGAHIVEVRVVVEKLGFGGRDFVLRETGLDVKAAIGIEVDSGGRVWVREVGRLPYVGAVSQPA